MLFLCGYTLSFTAMIGLIALIGIEIKNSILLVDFTNQLRLQGKPLDDAIAEAGEIRFLPILLTSVTAIGGLLPLALQNRSEEHTSELQSLMRISYAVFCLNKKIKTNQ